MVMADQYIDNVYSFVNVENVKTCVLNSAVLLEVVTPNLPVVQPPKVIQFHQMVFPFLVIVKVWIVTILSALAADEVRICKC